ncbi:methyltransferase domain-containing protein [Marivita sp. S0852]|uniref:methyltransferase domain-containing protein n=1 Tax=Marivita sp. S0852 TaxID=3373893 RepID=UPI0039823371
MQHELTDPGAISLQYDVLRHRFIAEVSKIVVELGKVSGRNVPLVQATCLNIDTLVREYQVFLAQMTAVRVQHEAQCADHSEVIAVRRIWGEVTARTGLFRNELNRWPEYRALVTDQLKPKRQKLYTPDDKLPKIAQSQILASDDIFDRLHAVLNPAPQSDAAKAHACFADVALPNSDFHRHLHAAYRLVLSQRRSGPIRFLDVGCGGGLKVFSALRYFDEAHGFDYDPAFVAFGERLLEKEGASQATVFEQDALTFDRYDAFDVIYFYRPISDDDLLFEMEKRINALARPGTVLIAPYRVFGSRHDMIGCGRVDGGLYLSQTSQRQADAWRRKAELTGTYIARRDDSLPGTIWAPLLDASRQNGCDLAQFHAKQQY